MKVTTVPRGTSKSFLGGSRILVPFNPTRMLDSSEKSDGPQNDPDQDLLPDPGTPEYEALQKKKRGSRSPQKLDDQQLADKLEEVNEAMRQRASEGMLAAVSEPETDKSPR